ncbi:MAG: thioredoxin family protein [Actinomycetota bacterium]
MVTVATNTLPLQSALPEFALPDTKGKIHSSGDFADAPGLLVMFICNHCPYVQFVASELAVLTSDFQRRGLGVAGINPNAATHPDDAPAKMPEEVASRGYEFPYLIDEDQTVAKAYKAACTPEFFLFDRDRKLVYHGQFDHSRPRRNVPVTGADLKAAVDAVLEGQPVPENPMPSAGCSIKWKDDPVME